MNGSSPTRLILLGRFQVALLLGAMACGNIVQGADETLFQSTSKQTTLIELFTAEGCSTCPAAEEWLGRLKSDPGLWREIVPVAFHVDYWDQRGWKDRFASPVFSRRQRAYAAAWNAGSAYTPAFAVNGREWKAPEKLPAAGAANAGVLKIARASEGRLTITYSQFPASDAQWDLHLALLGSGLVSKIGGGENAGRQLRHDFTALSYDRIPMMKETDIARAEATLPQSKEKEGRMALAAWITKRNQNVPVQSTGGWLR